MNNVCTRKGPYFFYQSRYWLSNQGFCFAKLESNVRTRMPLNNNSSTTRKRI